MNIPLTLAAALLALPAAATSWVAEKADPAHVAALEACAGANLPDRGAAEAACIGRISEPCMGTPEGGTTIGMVDCLTQETLAWDVILNADWPKLRKLAKAIDEDQAMPGMELPSYAETLLTAQRAWLAFRDAECANQAAEWGAGSHRNIAYQSCFMALTARRTLALRARLQDSQW